MLFIYYYPSQIETNKIFSAESLWIAITSKHMTSEVHQIVCFCTLMETSSKSWKKLINKLCIHKHHGRSCYFSSPTGFFHSNSANSIKKWKGTGRYRCWIWKTVSLKFWIFNQYIVLYVYSTLAYYQLGVEAVYLGLNAVIADN